MRLDDNSTSAHWDELAIRHCHIGLNDVPLSGFPLSSFKVKLSLLQPNFYQFSRNVK